jgi:hypothetical protein
MPLTRIRALPFTPLAPRAAATMLALSKHSTDPAPKSVSVTWPIRAPWTNEDRPEVETKLATKRVS